MKQYYMDFSAQAQHQVAEPVLRSRVMAAAIAVAITLTQPLPSGEVDNAGGYFTNHVMPAAMGVISDFNEASVFDTKAALDYVRQLWMLRYWTAYRPTHDVVLGASGCFFSAYTGIEQVVAENFRTFMDTNAKSVVSLSQFAKQAICAHQAALATNGV